MKRVTRVKLNKSFMSILVFMSETNIRQGTAMFIHNLVTNCIGYSNPFLTQKKPRNERKKTGKTISITSINIIFSNNFLKYFSEKFSQLSLRFKSNV